MIVFSPLEHNESPISLICKLAVCFAEREELVLVVDAWGDTCGEPFHSVHAVSRTDRTAGTGRPLDPTLVDGSAECEWRRSGFRTFCATKSSRSATSCCIRSTRGWTAFTAESVHRRGKGSPREGSPTCWDCCAVVIR